MTTPLKPNRAEWALNCIDSDLPSKVRLLLRIYSITAIFKGRSDVRLEAANMQGDENVCCQAQQVDYGSLHVCSCLGDPVDHLIVYFQPMQQTITE
jgi:hypothetical protein